mgnify:CR=1 FL=1
MKRGWKIILIVLVLIILAAAIYFTSFFSYTCKDMACFRSHQEKCVHTKFTYDTEETNWLYYIKGKADGKCEINVKVLQIKAGSIKRTVLEGKSMDCFLPLKSLAPPESDLSLCHGLLKEELQNLIIQKLHTYIIDNVGEIGAELEGIVPGTIQSAGNASSS